MQPTNQTITTASTTQPIKLLRCCEVAERLGISKSTIYSKLNKKNSRFDPTFPKPIKLTNSTVRWIESEIAAWAESFIVLRDESIRLPS